jgi:hypothetical protein
VAHPCIAEGSSQCDQPLAGEIQASGPATALWSTSAAVSPVSTYIAGLEECRRFGPTGPVTPPSFTGNTGSRRVSLVPVPKVVGGCIGVVLVGALALTTSACSTGPSEAAKTLCTSVGQVLAASPDRSVAISTQAITDGQNSGDSRLDAAARYLAAALSQGSRLAIGKADSEIETACARLGIWQTYHESG